MVAKVESAHWYDIEPIPIEIAVLFMEDAESRGWEILGVSWSELRAVPTNVITMPGKNNPGSPCVLIIGRRKKKPGEVDHPRIKGKDRS